MKRLIFALVIICTVNTYAYAQTREEFAEELIDAFRLEGDFKGLYRYADWMQISKERRRAVSIAAQTGIYAPEVGLYEPWRQVESAEIALTEKGLDRFLLQSDTYEKRLGRVESMNSTRVYVLDDGGIMLELPIDTPFMGMEGIGNCRDLRIGDNVCVALGSGESILVWRQKNMIDNSSIENYDTVVIRRGMLYLYDNWRSMFIVTDAGEFRRGAWGNRGIKYDDLQIHSAAKIFANGKLVNREAINDSWLDKKVRYIVGKNPSDGGMLKVIHVEYE
jgi:hypothetical protein